MYPRIALLIVLSVSIFQQAQAQLISDRFRDVLRTHMEFGIQGGGAGYLGEINDRIYGFNSWTVGAGAKYYFDRIDQRDRTWGVRLDYNLLNIQGDDSESSNAAQQERNFHFTNRIHELAAAAEFHFWEFRPNRSRNLMTPYLFAGVGLIRHNPKAEHPRGSGNRVSLIEAMVEPRINESGNPSPRHKYVMTIPFGAGFKYNLSRSWAPFSIGVELNYRYAFSDFLDGIGNGRDDSKYIAYNDANVPSAWSQSEWEQLAGPHTGLSYTDLQTGNYKRGNPGNDFFMTATFRITYTLYKWRDPLWK